MDPHTYPGRGWPFSRLTVLYTDRYIRKSFQQVQRRLDPDSVFFLGDLFDGGREWSPPGAEDDGSGDKRWRGYGQKYWFNEYRRFGRLFVDTWLKGAGRLRGGERKIVTSLPGNHDLGLGNGIRIPVRNRFNAYFGAGNRIDLVGNHTFVSVDTVSLSAKDQIDPATGAPKTDDVSISIWEPTEQFLHLTEGVKARMISRYLRVQDGRSPSDEMEHAIIELDDPRAQTISLGPNVDADLPSILLTHVPLYRGVGTPCGPLRERYPPSNPSSSSGEPPEKDEANAILLQQGEQYQNVLTSAISNSLINLIGDITHVFSGDDHDYCEMVHREFTSPRGGGIKEITVKSVSWAMGVRKPGFLLVSLWNPIDKQGKALGSQKTTVQSHLCLLPDQLSIFIRYAWMVAFTSVVLLLRSVRVVFSSSEKDKMGDGGILPLSHMQPAKRKEGGRVSSSASSATSEHSYDGLAARSGAGRAKSVSPAANGYRYTPPPNDAAKAWQDIELDGSGARRTSKGLNAVLFEMRRSLGTLAAPVLVWYLWLLWSS